MDRRSRAARLDLARSTVRMTSGAIGGPSPSRSLPVIAAAELPELVGQAAGDRPNVR